MKIRLLLLVFSIISLPSIYAQQTINGTLQHGGVTRSYILYVPASYNASEASPLLMSFHGFSSNAQINFGYTDFKSIADAEGFILIHPQGTPFNGIPHWNVGGFTLGSTTDDVGFVGTMIEKISNEYTIDQDRIYSTGMSNGGYMSFLLACQLSDKIAAIASVTGSMTPQTFDSCDPQHPTPVLQIHGTKDGTVPYEGNSSWTKSIDNVLTYWKIFNNCNTDVAITNIPNTNTSDGSTVDKFVYSGGDNCVSTEHFKVYNGDHDWPGAWGNMDINASKEVWQFLSQYDINGLIGCGTTSTIDKITDNDLRIYPNPTASSFTIERNNKAESEYSIFTSLGVQVASGIINGNKTIIDVSTFDSNIYFINIGDQVLRFLKVN